MCDHLDHEPSDPEPNVARRAGLSRRDLLRRGAGVLAAGALLPGASRLVGSAVAYADTTAAGQLVVPMAMHVHGSFSEGAAGVGASWETQLAQARLAGVTVLWPTDHDWRMSALGAPDVFHTASLTETVLARRYTWRPRASGALASSTAQAVPQPASPADPAAVRGALRLQCVSSGAEPASQRLWLDGVSANNAHKTNVAGQVVRLQVLPETVGAGAWGELLVTLSHHPAGGGRPDGLCQLSYRFGDAPALVVAQGLLGIVTVPVVPGQWNEVALDLVADAAAAWPDLVAADNCVNDLWLGATSQSSQPASVLFAYLRITRSSSGDRPLQAQAQIFDAYRSRYPDVAVVPGLEVSLQSAHTNGFGGTRSLPDYTSPDLARLVTVDPAAYGAWSVQWVHDHGGLASLNHPFGSQAGLVSQAEQDTARRALARSLLASRANGADVLEVGYRQRGGASLATHLLLWDALSRGGVWLTGNGVNDAHGGAQNDWRKLTNRFVTTVTAATTSEADLLGALAAGRAYVCELGFFSGLLDLTAGGCPMGSVSVQPGVAQRPLTVMATALPRGSRVQVVQGPVDYGTAVDAGGQVVTSLPASSFVTGSTTVLLDTTRSSFARVEVLTGGGRLVAFSNPVWLLQEQPPVAPPVARVASDSVPRGATPCVRCARPARTQADVGGAQRV